MWVSRRTTDEIDQEQMNKTQYLLTGPESPSSQQYIYDRWPVLKETSDLLLEVQARNMQLSQGLLVRRCFV